MWRLTSIAPLPPPQNQAEDLRLVVQERNTMAAENTEAAGCISDLHEQLDARVRQGTPMLPAGSLAFH